MNFLTTAFNLILYQPLLNALVLLYIYLPGHDFGIAIIILTILIKFLFYPLGKQSIKSQKSLSELQPKIKEIQEKHKQDKEKQTKEIMALYKREKISPFSGCLPILIQLPVLIALYRVFWNGLQPEQMDFLYKFVVSPGAIDPTLFGFINLSQPNFIIALLNGVLQFIQIKMIGPKKIKKQGASFSDELQKQMQYFMPVFIVLILFRLPSALGLYFLVSSLFTIIQQYVILRKKNDEPGQFTTNKNNN
ncbi:MAG: YidC/Oxa1 family membrane protein insertase [bacterium]|nr:YidC/Oxa1 family membrane protein insertase [bacterium]